MRPLKCHKKTKDSGDNATIDKASGQPLLHWIALESLPTSSTWEWVTCKTSAQGFEAKICQGSRALWKVHSSHQWLSPERLCWESSRGWGGPLWWMCLVPSPPSSIPPRKARENQSCLWMYRSVSLNNCLYQGPDFNNALVGVLTRFRQEPVALVSDIESMFNQVQVTPAYRDALRFLWWPEGDTDQRPQRYRMKVHLFGGVSSPSSSGFALRKIAADNKDAFSAHAVNTVENNVYVDDCLKSVADEDVAVDLVRDLRDLLSKGGFWLTKWLTNSKRVAWSIPECKRAKSMKHLDFKSMTVERALGLNWDVHSDTLQFRVKIKEKPPHLARDPFSHEFSVRPPGIRRFFPTTSKGLTPRPLQNETGVGGCHTRGIFEMLAAVARRNPQTGRLPGRSPCLTKRLWHRVQRAAPFHRGFAARLWRSHRICVWWTAMDGLIAPSWLPSPDWPPWVVWSCQQRPCPSDWTRWWGKS